VAVTLTTLVPTMTVVVMTGFTKDIMVEPTTV
jgi:hypothetical protein